MGKKGSKINSTEWKTVFPSVKHDTDSFILMSDVHFTPMLWVTIFTGIRHDV